MNAEATTASPGLASLRQQARNWWHARTPRERQAVIVVALVIGLFVVWSLLVQPALRTTREAPAQLDLLEAQYQQMQRIANEATTLRGATRVSPTQAAAALKAATDRLGTNARLTVQGDRATLTLTSGVSAEALRAWLNEARSGARARPDRCAIAARPDRLQRLARADARRRAVIRLRRKRAATCGARRSPPPAGANRPSPRSNGTSRAAPVRAGPSSASSSVRSSPWSWVRPPRGW